MHHRPDQGARPFGITKLVPVCDQARVHAEGLVDQGFDAEVEAIADQAAAALRQGCLAMPDPGPQDLFAHVYAGPHPLLAEEQEAYDAYLAGELEDPEFSEAELDRALQTLPEAPALT